MTDLLFRLFAPLLAIPVWSRLWGKIVGLKRPRWFSRLSIGWFRRHYRIPMDEYLGEPGDYDSLKAFFTRPLDPEKRPFRLSPDSFQAPADGCISRIDVIRDDAFIQVKGRDYPLTRVLGTPLDFTSGWLVITLYLSPENYHRFHVPAAARARRYLHAGTRLFPVNRRSVATINELFIRNERVIVEMEKDHTHFYFVAVGATFVGSIRMEFSMERRVSGTWQDIDRSFSQMAELGRFDQGSTIIVAVPVEMVKEIMVKEEQPVRTGDEIFSLRSHSC